MRRVSRQLCITVTNRQRRVRLARDSLQRFAENALHACLRVRGGNALARESLPQIHVSIISDRVISSLHQQFMNISGPTDVITFQHGEIVISADTAARHAEEYGTSITHELRLYIVHGLLHLRGFDDRDARSRRTMSALQERILRQIG